MQQSLRSYFMISCVASSPTPVQASATTISPVCFISLSSSPPTPCALVSTAVSHVSRRPWTGIPVRENPRKFQRSVSSRRTSTERSSIAVTAIAEREVATGTRRMGSLLERFSQHTKANRHHTKKAYDSKPKTIRLRKKASRAIASYSNRSAADSMKNHRAEHKPVIAINTLSCLIDISNTLRHIAQHGIPGCQELCVNAAGCQQVSVSPAGATDSDVSSGPSTAAEMPVRCGPDKMPDECLWDLPSDEDEDKEN
ncbi:hypothetical protein FOVSG1_004892 [Fusarium oxysporum f. sp. vasinfectum]